MLPDLLIGSTAFVCVWTFLRLVSDERERMQSEIGATAAASPPQPPAAAAAAAAPPSAPPKR